MNNLVKLANRLFFLVLRLHPLAGVSDFYEEMHATYAQVISESSGRGVKTLWQILRELIDLPGVILRFWIFGRKAMAENLSSTDLTSPPTPWRTALISLLLFIWIGPVTLAFSYAPFWSDPVWGPRFWLGENILMAVVIFAGILIGIKRGFPRWSYPYVIGGVLALTFLLLEILKPTPLRNQQLLVLVAVAVVFTAATVRWRPFLLFWAHIRQDWTYLSYGLFFIVMILSFGVDHDEVPHLTVVVMLPSLLTLAGALVHLRSTTRVRRILALVLSMTIALPIWISPVFDGMMRSPSSRAEVFTLLFGGYFILLAILLAPALIGLVKRKAPGEVAL